MMIWPDRKRQSEHVLPMCKQCEESPVYVLNDMRTGEKSLMVQLVNVMGYVQLAELENIALKHLIGVLLRKQESHAFALHVVTHFIYAVPLRSHHIIELSGSRLDSGRIDQAHFHSMARTRGKVSHVNGLTPPLPFLPSSTVSAP